MFTLKKVFLSLTIAFVASIPSVKADVTGTATNGTDELESSWYYGTFHLVNGAGAKRVKVRSEISVPSAAGPMTSEWLMGGNLITDVYLGLDTYFSPAPSTPYTMYSAAHWRYPDSGTWHLVDEDTDTGILP
jgi:hypothetical protein